MSANSTPREVFEQLVHRISTGAWIEAADLYAEDVVVDLPFALPVPGRAVGREQLRDHFALAAAGTLTVKAENVVVHETTDPETVIAEYDYLGHDSGTGRSFRAANIQVLTVREGLITATRDYHHHVAIAAATGRLAELVAALEQ